MCCRTASQPSVALCCMDQWRCARRHKDATWFAPNLSTRLNCISSKFKRNQERSQGGGQGAMPPIVDWLDFYGKKLALLGRRACSSIYRKCSVDLKYANALVAGPIRRSASLPPNVKFWLRPERNIWVRPTTTADNDHRLIPIDVGSSSLRPISAIW